MVLLFLACCMSGIKGAGIRDACVMTVMDA